MATGHEPAQRPKVADVTSALDQIGDEQFVSLTTFRRNGVGVPTPVWVARDGAALVVTTQPGTGKVKRLRRDPRVTLRPCTRRGEVRPEVPIVSGTAEIVDDPDQIAGHTAALAAKYGLPFRLIGLVGKLTSRSRPGRVILEITPA